MIPNLISTPDKLTAGHPKWPYLKLLHLLQTSYKPYFGYPCQISTVGCKPKNLVQNLSTTRKQTGKSFNHLTTLQEEDDWVSFPSHFCPWLTFDCFCWWFLTFYRPKSPWKNTPFGVRIFFRIQLFPSAIVFHPQKNRSNLRKADIWSLGLSLYFMALGKLPRKLGDFHGNLTAFAAAVSKPLSFGTAPWDECRKGLPGGP